MKNLLLIAIFLFSPIILHAQNIARKADVIIHLTGCDAWGDHRFFIDIYKKGNSAKIVYSYRDSLKRSQLTTDPEYQRMHNELKKYNYNDPSRKPFWDTIGRIFDRLSTYTRDSITLNLKKDIAYKTLLQNIVTANKQEFVPEKPQAALDGNALSLTVITPKDEKMISVAAAELTTHPLLIGFVINTLDRDKISNTVLKIRKFYFEFDRANYH